MIENITQTQNGYRATIDGTEWYVPLAPGNRHYDEIMRQVEAGTLVIQDATPTETIKPPETEPSL